MTGRGSPIRVILVEGASPQRDRLVELIQEERDIAVAHCLGTAAEAIGAVSCFRPDAVILDLHLADDRGREVIEQIMAHTPTPILGLSSRIRDRHSPSAVDALVAGALEVLPRPSRWTGKQGDELRRAVRQISKVHVIRHPRGSRTVVESRSTGTRNGHQPVVAVAASTGGPSALATVLSGLAGLGAPVLVVQHLHPDFTAGLVEWMARVSALPVEIASHGQLARAGRVYVAPGEHHLRYAGGGMLELATSPVMAHRPSADELFTSVAQKAGAAAVGVILTGMGEDGARGLLAIHERGGQTFAQDESTSTVFGMPKAAARLGGVTEMLPLEGIAAVVQRSVREAAGR